MTGTAIRAEGGHPTGTFRVYEDDALVGWVLTKAKPGEGPHWTRALGYQGITATSGIRATWGETKDEAIASLVAAYHAQTATTPADQGR